MLTEQEIFSELVKLSLFSDPSENDIVLLTKQLSPESLIQKDKGVVTAQFNLPLDVFPSGCKVIWLEWENTYGARFRQMLDELRPSNIFFFPPWIARRHIAERITADYPYKDLYEVSLRAAIECLPVGTMLGILLPMSAFIMSGSRGLREFLIESCQIRFLIELPLSSVFNMSPLFQLQFMVLEVGTKLNPVSKFFRIAQVQSKEEVKAVVHDFGRLLEQGGGTTKYGYVVRSQLLPETPWHYYRYHPQRDQEVLDMSSIGEMRTLGDLVDIYRGPFSSARYPNTMPEGQTNIGVPVLEGRNITSDGVLNIDEPRVRVENPPVDILLLAGDLCMRSMLSPLQKRLNVVRIGKSALPLAAAASVLVLRPKPHLTDDEVALLLQYLNSTHAAKQYELLMVGSMAATPAQLRQLPVPVPDDAVRLACQSLKEASQQFSSWQAEAQEAIDSLFATTSLKTARVGILATGRRTRQRVHVARQVDDIHFRIRTQYPHPIAYRWRAVESAKPDLEGLSSILDCAEVTACYLACIALTLVRSLQETRIAYIETMATRITRRGSGTNMGDWISILREARSSRQLRGLPELVSFYEVLRFLDNEEVDHALQSLKELRDKLAHRKGPKGSHLHPVFNEAMQFLEGLMQSVEFLSEYPLRYIEWAKRDSIRGNTAYHYYELMGDHPLVPLDSAITDLPELEVQSLYLVDREGQLHLLRPLLTRRECPECGAWATFYLDSYEATDDVCTLVGMEHNHTCQVKTVTEAFRAVGMIL